MVTNIEDEVLTPLLRWFVDLDHQYRDKALTVRQYGDLGLKISMIDVPPINSGRRYEMRWWGVEAARSSQQIQQQIATINVVKGIPPDQLPGHKLNLVPVVELLIENAFGSRLAPQIFENVKDKMSIPAEMENDMLIMGLALPVHELDDDQQHMQEHLKALGSSGGDPTRAVRTHMYYHREQMSKKLKVQMAGLAGMQPGGNPQMPGPRPGAQPGQARGRTLLARSIKIVYKAMMLCHGDRA
jgi:hypothetical protein